MRLSWSARLHNLASPGASEFYATTLVAGFSTPVALLLAAAGGAFGGLLTWFINTKLGVGRVISSVLSMIILVLSAPYVSGGSTKSLLDLPTIQTTIDHIDAIISRELIGNQPYQMHLLFSAIWLGAYAVILGFMMKALSVRIGLQLRYLGSARNQVSDFTAAKTPASCCWALCRQHTGRNWGRGRGAAPRRFYGQYGHRNYSCRTRDSCSRRGAR